MAGRGHGRGRHRSSARAAWMPKAEQAPWSCRAHSGWVRMRWVVGGSCKTKGRPTMERAFTKLEPYIGRYLT